MGLELYPWEPGEVTIWYTIEGHDCLLHRIYQLMKPVFFFYFCGTSFFYLLIGVSAQIFFIKHYYGAGEMVQLLRACIPLSEDPNLVPSTHMSDDSQLPVTQAPGNQTSSSGFFKCLNSHTHSQVQMLLIKNRIKSFHKRRKIF